ncbi:MAG TPA: hypothetical protein PL045_13860 [Chitinophagaceae bacterium]|nr:hypothetical protein [Chitinophagaceae bacterium]
MFKKILYLTSISLFVNYAVWAVLLIATDSKFDLKIKPAQAAVYPAYLALVSTMSFWIIVMIVSTDLFGKYLDELPKKNERL